MAEDFPYRAEYSKSNRASCRACKTQIAKDSLRLAALVQSPLFDGKTAQWYHYMCFFTKQRVKNVGDIEHFGNLKWDDQEKIRKKVEAAMPVASGGDTTEKKGKKRPAKGKKSDDLLFAVEYAKSGRAGCRGCEEKILKDEVRICKMDFESDEGRRYGGVPRWHHVECFTKLRVELEYFAAGNTIKGYNTLKKEDKEIVDKALPEIAEVKKEEGEGVSAAKKVKTEKLDDEQMAKMKKQNKTMYKYIKDLKALSKKELSTLLEYNKQDVPVGDSVMVEWIADCMTFGALLPCEKCQNGQLVYTSGVGYKCTGNATEWVKCENVELEPKRIPFKAPSEMIEEHPFLKIKSKVSNRVMQIIERSIPAPPASTLSGPKVKSEKNYPLKNMEFVILGNTETSKDELKKQIVKMGGKVTTKIHDKLAAVISTQEECDKDVLSSRMKAVCENNIQVVPERFLQESVGGGAIENIKKLNMASWGSDPKKRLEEVSLKSSGKSRSQFAKSGPSKITLKVKGGTAVDPDSGLEDVAHVYTDGKTLYTTVLGLTDIASGINKYYKMQILESDKKNNYWFFRSWGRIGTTIGGTKLENKGSLGEAKKDFKFHYYEKSGNDWENRNNFQKVPMKMIPMDLNYGEDEVDSLDMKSNTNVESKLPKQVQDLVSMILNIDSMKKVMLEFELDLQKMPLGKISKEQIQSAYSILAELQETLKKSDPSRVTILDVSNRFYTLIPHDFGINNPPLLDTEDIIKSKLEMLESLLEMEIAYNIMKPVKSEGDDACHPIDSNYAKLNTDIKVIEKESKDFDLLQQYLKNTHASTHNQYDLEILEAFKITRHGEDKRYKPFKKLHNKKLLWHGSRTTNFAGILAQGLRIAPPEAPSTGYMFGKGIYFADMVSKSANYCMTTPTNNVGLLMLCEVALGNMYERTHAEYVKKLPKGTHSTKGLGATAPDPESSVKIEGDVEVPLGPSKTVLERNKTSLLYNEYIVYDVAQVKTQYLLKVNFKYKF